MPGAVLDAPADVHVDGGLRSDGCAALPAAEEGGMIHAALAEEWRGPYRIAFDVEREVASQLSRATHVDAPSENKSEMDGVLGRVIGAGKRIAKFPAVRGVEPVEELMDISLADCPSLVIESLFPFETGGDELEKEVKDVFLAVPALRGSDDSALRSALGTSVHPGIGVAAIFAVVESVTAALVAEPILLACGRVVEICALGVLPVAQSVDGMMGNDEREVSDAV